MYIDVWIGRVARLAANDEAPEAQLCQHISKSVTEVSQAVTIHTRSVELSSKTLGVFAKLDLVEGVGTLLQLVDYRRGKKSQYGTQHR